VLSAGAEFLLNLKKLNTGLIWMQNFHHILLVLLLVSHCGLDIILQGKRGIEKQPFQLPDFIAATGIEKIRQVSSIL
jgi:hypothetical protein